MSIKEQIVADLTAAMKNKDQLRLSVVRMLKSKMMEAEVELRAKKGLDYALADEEALGVIAAYAKQRRDSIEAYRRGGREDLAAKEEAELAIIQRYLPARASEDEIRRVVSEAIAACGASSMKDMGAVMKIVTPKLKGAADGAVISGIVRGMLGGGGGC
jgi:uncharacterized protein YqeY